jgi:predicted HicB family RNase H-like nuclease
MKTMAYKDYVGSAEVSVEDGVLHGKLLGIRDLVTYEAETPAGLRRAFEEAVNDYLADCEKEHRGADRPYKGSLNVRIGPELHRSLALEAIHHHVTINHLILTRLKAVQLAAVELKRFRIMSVPTNPLVEINDTMNKLLHSITLAAESQEEPESTIGTVKNPARKGKRSRQSAASRAG